MDLKTLQAKSCKDSNSKKLTDLEVDEYSKLFTNWGFDVEGRFISNFEFDNFQQTVDFLNTVANLAEKEGHHPDLLIYGYNNLLTMLYTHDVDGITEKDFIMAAKIEDLLYQK